MNRSIIEISAFDPPEPIGAWRAEVIARSRGRAYGRSTKERGLASGAAILMNLVMLYALGLGASQPPTLIGRRAASPPAQVIEAFFIEPPRISAVIQEPIDSPVTMKALRLDVLAYPPKLEAIEVSAGDSARDVGAVATAITAVSPEFERQQLRAIYRERLQDHLSRRLRPGAELTAQCVMRIHQNSTGDVLNLEMVDCGAMASEQATLREGIERAAPLPRPPRDDVLEPELVVTVGKQVDVDF